MKTRSLTTLATAMLLGTCALAYGQSAAGTVNGAAQTTVEAGTGATGAAVSGGAEVDADVSTEAGGTTSAGATAQTEVDLTLDTNGDGTVDADEQAVGDEAAATRPVAEEDGEGLNEICSSVDLTAMGEAAQADALALVTSAQVSRLSDCEDGTVGALSAEAQAALTANEAITRVLEQETVGAGEILGISVEGTTAVIYVRDDESETDTTTAQ